MTVNPDYNHDDPEYVSNEQMLPKFEGGEAFCLCNERQYDGKLMFQCDFCDNWFHPECLDMSKEEIKAKEQQGDKELWFHSDECKNQYVFISYLYENI